MFSEQQEYEVGQKFAVKESLYSSLYEKNNMTDTEKPIEIN